ncbi:hypothetical protein [Jatrophihabitans sp.]|uniref:hypothetical protein n=1 Tax=Jatrophihabitans sp. TaxID=1932789 RepID=UPI0030C67C2A|nr:hypothetical protein [Jatrophihabitans sp.]
MIPKVTTPAPKYGPTAAYGDCEAGDCRAVARMTCESCEGEFCLGHSEHAAHVDILDTINTR